MIFRLDPTGVSPDNKIVDEIKVVSPPAQVTDANMIVPEYTPFFHESLVVTLGGKRLVEGVDYLPIFKHVAATEHFQRELFGGIMFYRKEFTGTVKLTYQTLGGDFQVKDSQELLRLTRALGAVRWITFDQIMGVPSGFPPHYHLHDIETGLVDMGDVVDAVDRIGNAIKQLPASGQETAVKLQAHLTSTNAHSKAAVGLSNVSNYGVSSMADVAAKATDKYVTADLLFYYVSGQINLLDFVTRSQLNNAISSIVIPTYDLSTYITRSELNQTLTSLNTDIANSVYSKAQINSMFNSYYTAAQIDNLFANYTPPAQNVDIMGGVKVSTDTGNTLVKRANGLYVPTPPAPPALPDLSVYALASDVQTLRDEVTRLNGLVTAMKKITDGLLVGSFIINTTYEDNTSYNNLYNTTTGSIDLVSIDITDIVSLQTSPTISNHTKSREVSLNMNGRDDVRKDYITRVDVVVPNIVTSLDQIVLYWSSEVIKRRYGGGNYTIMSELPTMSFNSSTSTLTITGKWSIDLRIGIKAATT